jgi:flagellar export protein FliJ
VNITALRNYRAQLEEVLRAELADLEVSLKGTADQCRRVQEAADQAADLYLLAVQEGMTAEEAVGQYADIASRAEAVKTATAALTHARRRWEDKRAEVMEAAREHKKYARLEQRRTIRLKSLESRAEQQILDEAARNRFLRQQWSLAHDRR